MIKVSELLAKQAAAPAKKSAAEIAAGLKAADKAINYDNLVISRIGTTGLFEDVIEGTNEIRVFRAPEKQFFTVYVGTARIAADIDADGNIVEDTHFYCSFYELLGVLKQSPMAAFVDSVASDPTLATVLLPGATISVCAEAVEVGDYTNPFSDGKKKSTVKGNTFYHHIYSLGVSPAAKTAMEARAAKLAQF